MTKYGISIDVGTSGVRAQAIDLNGGKIISTVLTMCHPLPGANVMDHMTFCLTNGNDVAHKILMDTVNKVIGSLRIELRDVEKVSICGNPIQLSIFQGIPVDDLAFAGKNAYKSRNITVYERKGGVFNALEVGLNVRDNVELYVPPAIKHEVGADALAMMYKSGFMEHKGNCMVTDYGTNAEMALKVGDKIFTGSASAGPAMEGQSINCGVLAAPGTICDIKREDPWRIMVLDENYFFKEGDRVDLKNSKCIEHSLMHGKSKGITGIGVVAAISAILEEGIWGPDGLKTPDGRLILQDGFYLDNHDINEVFKAVGAIRAGHYTLAQQAGIDYSNLETMYLAGASGTYVDAIKARNIGLIPPSCTELYQIGNTSLLLATDILRDPEVLDNLRDVADQLRSDHVMFATNDIFKQVYIQELAYWCEGMPIENYNANLASMGLQPLPSLAHNPKVHRSIIRDIPDMGVYGYTIISNVGTLLTGKFDGCSGCKRCANQCPEGAISVSDDNMVFVKTKNCLGASCFRCQQICPSKVFDYNRLTIDK